MLIVVTSYQGPKIWVQSNHGYSDPKFAYKVTMMIILTKTLRTK